MDDHRAIRSIGVAVLVCSVALPSRSYAQSTKAAAEALFQEGRRLIDAGQIAEACPKFADSERLDPAPGTLINLANCYERNGQTATAWATYREAEGAAVNAHRGDYEAVAKTRGAALAPRLSRMTVTTPPIDGIEVKRDGVIVGRGELGVAIPVDPGKHTLQATAPGRKPWSTVVDVAADSASVTVQVPQLEAKPEPPPAEVALANEPAPALAASPQADLTPSAPPSTAGSTQRLAGLITAGAGLVGVGVGTAFTLVGKSRYDESLSHCPQTNVCDDVGVSRRDDARSAGTVATVAFGVGAAALVTGGVLWLSAPSSHSERREPPPRVSVAPTLGGALIRGTW
jgi:hypothetical protein